MNRTEIKSSLIAVKGCGEYFGTRFLLYKDEGWDCDFLPNRKTIDPSPDEAGRLARYLSEHYGIPLGDFDIEFVAEAESEKACAEHGDQLRYYHYRLYEARVKRMPEAWSKPAFRAADGRECRWMSVEEMLADERIRLVNRDVVAAVRDYM